MVLKNCLFIVTAPVVMIMRPQLIYNYKASEASECEQNGFFKCSHVSLLDLFSVKNPLNQYMHVFEIFSVLYLVLYQFIKSSNVLNLLRGFETDRPTKKCNVIPLQ